MRRRRNKRSSSDAEEEAPGLAAGGAVTGTFWLVPGGCGSAVLAANFAGPVHGLGIGFVGGEAVSQLCLCSVAPIARAVIAGIVYPAGAKR